MDSWDHPGEQSLGKALLEKAHYKEAKQYHFQALTLAENAKLPNIIALTNIFISQDYADSGDYTQALKYANLSLKSYEVLGDIEGQAFVHSILSWIYSQAGMYPESMKHQFDILKIKESTGDSLGIALAYSNLAGFYKEQGDYKKAIEIHQRLIDIILKNEDQVNLAGTYYEIGVCYLQIGQYEEALKNHRLGLETGIRNQNRGQIGLAYSGIGDVFFDQHKNAEAARYYRNAITEFKAVDNKLVLARQQIKLGECLTRMGLHDASRHHFREAFALITQLESIREYNRYYGGMAQLDSATGQWKAAYYNYRYFISTRDSMFNEENTKKMVQSRMSFEFEKKEAAAKAEQEKKDALAGAELRRQKMLRNGFMGGFAAVMAFASIFFFQRNKIKAGKKRSDELLLNILPAEVAEELKQKGAAEARLIDEVTVLFSDFKDFTILSEKLTPKELVSEINACFSAFDMIMQRHGVEKIKTIGDAYMAAGGLPVPNATHASDVIRAALEMQAFMRQRREEREAEDRFFFEARVGIHTGPVVAGIVGIKKFAYDIWGDTVNTAQRMESVSEPGKINISGNTSAQAKDAFRLLPRGRIAVKSKGEVEMYYVEGVAEAATA